MSNIDDAKALLKSAVDSNRDNDGTINMPETADYLADLLSNINGIKKDKNIAESMKWVKNDYDCQLLAQHLALRIAEIRATQNTQ
jgi:hypothetical protein